MEQNKNSDLSSFASTCQSVQDLLPAHVNKTATQEEQQLVTKHLPLCPVCQREESTLKRYYNAMSAALDTVPDPPQAVVDQAVKRVLEKINSTSQDQPFSLSAWFQQLWDQLRPVLIQPQLAWGVAFLLLVLHVFPFNGEEPVVPPHTAVVLSPSPALPLGAEQGPPIDSVEEQVRNVLQRSYKRAIEAHNLKGLKSIWNINDAWTQYFVDLFQKNSQTAVVLRIDDTSLTHRDLLQDSSDSTDNARTVAPVAITVSFSQAFASVEPSGPVTFSQTGYCQAQLRKDSAGDRWRIEMLTDAPAGRCLPSAEH